MIIRHGRDFSTSDALVTPTLTDWWLDVAPPADLAVSARSVGPPNANQPQLQSIAITVHNVGYRISDSAVVAVSAFDRNIRARKLISTAIGQINVNQSLTTIVQVSTENLPRRATLQVEVKPSKISKDLVLENNIAYYTIITNGSATQSSLHLFADGVEIMDGDYVATTPTIIVRPSRTEGITATGAELYVNGVPAGHGETCLKTKRNIATSLTDLSFTPTLVNGNHELRVRMTRLNDLGEIDTLEHSIHVNVLGESRIMQMNNFPNPFRKDTYFTFVLAGTKPPESVSIRIFTVAGRKIRDFNVTQNALQIGFNRVYWDGRDDEGDEIANGYYFYQVSLVADGKATSAIEKLVKVR